MGAEEQNESNRKHRICSCGCGNYFMPKRRDQKFLDRKHYMDHYNNTTRKERNRSKNEVIKAISKNDKILKEFYLTYRRMNTASCPLDLLLAKEFDESYCTGVEINNEGKVEHFYMFDFKYSLHNNKINIEKL